MKSAKEYNNCTVYIHYSKLSCTNEKETSQKWQPNKRKENENVEKANANEKKWMGKRTKSKKCRMSISATSSIGYCVKCVNEMNEMNEMNEDVPLLPIFCWMSKKCEMMENGR